MRRRAGGLVPVLLLGGAAANVALAGPAAADCGGPVVTVDDVDVAPGETVTVRGTGFGDDCHDTGPPPEGQGVLGKPLREVRLVIVHEGGELVVAEGAADDEYEFEVAITVPDVPPGAAALRTAIGDDEVSWSAADHQLTIADGDGPAPDAIEVVEFGPEPEPEASAPAQAPDRPRGGADDEAGVGLLMVTGALVVVLVGGAAVGIAAWGRRDTDG